MTDRVKDNQKFIKNIPSKEHLSIYEADIEMKRLIASALIDISKSIAIIADKLPENPDERALFELLNNDNYQRNERRPEEIIEEGSKHE